MVTLNLYSGKEIDYTIELPSEWNQLEEIEVVEISRIQLQNGGLQNLSRAAFFFFLIENRCKELPKDWKETVNLEDVTKLLYLIDFIWKENNLTKQPFPKLIVGGKELFGLKDSFQNITCGEFEDLEILFFQFGASPSEGLLAKMAAIIYREKGVPYHTTVNDRLIGYDFNSKSVAFLQEPIHILYTVFTWYCGCRQQLPKMFPNVYASDSNKSDEQPDQLAFTKCIHSGAGAKNGTRNQIRFMLLLEFMFDMEQEAIKTNELNALYDTP